MNAITLNEKAILDNIFEGYPVILTNERNEKLNISFEGDVCAKPFIVTIEHAYGIESRAFKISDDMMAYLNNPNKSKIINVKY